MRRSRRCAPTIPSRKNARRLVPEQIATGLELARERIAEFHARQLPSPIDYHAHDLTRYAFLARPLAAVGAYVPGGTATYPSSVLMTVVPAKVAGVERVVVVTPPQRDGARQPRGAVRLRVDGSRRAVRNRRRAGDRRARVRHGDRRARRQDRRPRQRLRHRSKAPSLRLRAASTGSPGPPKCSSSRTRARSPSSSRAKCVAQAEHDPLARVAAVSRDRALLERVAALLDGDFGRASGRDAIVAHVLDERTWLVHADTDAQILDVIERFAPEHLSLMVDDPYVWVPKIRHAGAIFVGDDTPVAAGDYLAGTNHTLPTSGAGAVLVRAAHGRLLAHDDAGGEHARADGSRRRAARRLGRLRRPPRARADRAHARRARSSTKTE